MDFIRKSADFSTLERHVNAPLIRRSFTVPGECDAEIVVASTGFYVLYLNGRDITKGQLAPYISAPDDIVCCDRYSVRLDAGENVVALMLGNGMQNSVCGFVWDFDKAAWRGAPSAAFTVKGEDGASVTWEQLLDGKKYALVDFWASWCGPCRREIPNLKAAYEKFASKGLEIISISIDKDAAAWQKALEEEQLPWPNFLDDADIDNLYGVKTIPAIFLLDGKGTVIAVGLRGEALQAKLAELLP